MSDQPFGSAAAFSGTTGRTGSGGGLRHSSRGSADILRALGLPREARTESPIPAEVRAALGLPAEAGSAVSLPAGTACFELHIGNPTSVGLVSKAEAAELPAPPPQVVIPFQVTVDLTSYPYNVLSGTFIFDSPEVTGWEITQGQFGTTGSPATPYVPNADMLHIQGEYVRTGIEGAEVELADSFFVPPSVLIVGWLRPPASYAGLFFNADGLYNANTLFKGWQACS
jgi:hypothetical protein